MDFDEQKCWVEWAKQNLTQLPTFVEARYWWLLKKIEAADTRPILVQNNRILPSPFTESDLKKLPLEMSNQAATRAYDDMKYQSHSFAIGKKLRAEADNKEKEKKLAFKGKVLISKFNVKGWVRVQIVISVVWATLALLNDISVIDDESTLIAFAKVFVTYGIIPIIWIWSPNLIVMAYKWVKEGFQIESKL